MCVHVCVASTFFLIKSFERQSSLEISSDISILKPLGYNVFLDSGVGVGHGENL